MHPRVVEIHERVVSGELSQRGAAREYGLNREAMRRHWVKHVPAAVQAAAAEAVAGGTTVEAIEGRALLGQATDVYERAVALFDTLEAQFLDGYAVDTRAVVSALREQRAALETVAKLAFAVQDRGTKAAAEEAPAIDAAILQALEARDFAVTQPAQQQQRTGPPRELGAGPSS